MLEMLVIISARRLSKINPGNFRPKMYRTRITVFLSMRRIREFIVKCTYMLPKNVCRDNFAAWFKKGTYSIVSVIGDDGEKLVSMK